MKSSWKSLCSFIIAMGLVISAVGCVGQVESGDVGTEPERNALGTDVIDGTSVDSDTDAPVNDAGSDAPPPNALCQGTSCTQI